MLIYGIDSFFRGERTPETLAPTKAERTGKGLHNYYLGADGGGAHGEGVTPIYKIGGGGGLSK